VKRLTGVLLWTALAAVACGGVVHAHDAHARLDWDHAPRGTLPWGALAKVGIRQEDGRTVPTFLPPVLALDGRKVTLYGFMAPAGKEIRSKQFLLSAEPLTCGSCEPVGPEGIVEVNARVPEPLSSRPVAVHGVLHVLRADPKNVLYRLTEARIVARGP
jgi:hypothetical protein